jgi:hypothetical protein
MFRIAEAGHTGRNQEGYATHSDADVRTSRVFEVSPTENEERG